MRDSLNAALTAGTERCAKFQTVLIDTTSVLQPLDQGIIAMVKGRYRKRLLQRVLTCLDKGDDISKLNTCITLKDACSWIASSVKEVPASTVRKCFARCGFTPDVMDVDEDVSLAQLVDHEDEIPLAQLAASVRTQLDVEDVMATTEEVSGFDDELPTCAMSSGSFEQDIIDAHQPLASTETEVGADNSDEEEEEEITAAAAPTSRKILEQFRVILASASVSAEVLHHVRRAEELLTVDILRGKIAATRQLTISEMFSQRQ